MSNERMPAWPDQILPGVLTAVRCGQVDTDRLSSDDEPPPPDTPPPPDEEPLDASQVLSEYQRGFNEARLEFDSTMIATPERKASARAKGRVRGR